VFTEFTRTVILVLGVAGVVRAGVVALEDTIPSGSLFLQPPVLTGAAPVFEGGGIVVANAFTAPLTAALYQISVDVEYEDLPSFGVTGTAPMLLTLFADSGDSPGSSIESWIVPLSPSDTKLDDGHCNFSYQRVVGGWRPILALRGSYGSGRYWHRMGAGVRRQSGYRVTRDAERHGHKQWMGPHGAKHGERVQRDRRYGSGTGYLRSQRPRSPLNDSWYASQVGKVNRMKPNQFWDGDY
jgi:hypothetical protein